MKQAYYARPKSIYKSPQEDRDIATISALGFGVVEIHKEELQKRASEQGMTPFKELVDKAEALFFRRFLDGSIGAGVGQEIEWALEAGLPVVELISSTWRERVVGVDETRSRLAELGER